ncbi:hypothetical protein Dsin_028843 [Dipteronia sinensis]|uniref:Phosphomannose isomerase type I catalytic domain-containing protein n=1 Tax=Dipteronia sinensis TaxID=43782 RepID=A0AAE0DVY0_9ROSI|nr:hypothetical protein Dsin_028843 [Dipteronia sinensis]
MEETNNAEITERVKYLHTPMKLVCPVKFYDWGVVGDNNSHVARLFSYNHQNSKIHPDDTYADFWIGTHESGPICHRRRQASKAGSWISRMSWEIKA